jgi:hypothetical protein
MREVRKSQIGESLVQLLAEEHPLEEDIGILDEDGNLLGVVITPRAYDFFLRKVEEAEDEMDNQSVENFRGSGEKS